MVGSHFLDFFSSRLFATILLVILILLSILGAVIPQETLYQTEEFVRWKMEHPIFSGWTTFWGLTHLFTNFLYITIILLLSVSIGICTYKRMTFFLKEYRKFDTDK